jgi:pimeloyl-ACP methyl ester carboxylesterase
VNNRAAIRILMLGLVTILLSPILPAGSTTPIESKSAEVEGLKLHYLTAGHGDVLILLHGYAETSRMWRPVIPLFADRFTVIAPDLPGIGESEIPKDGLSMKRSAEYIHALAKSLGVTKARVVGHDIGLMVSYAYATMFPSEVEKLVLMDAFVPGVPGWEDVYNSPAIWHFRFYGPTPEALVVGRERTFFEHFWNDFAADKNHSIPEAERRAYTAAYSAPGRMRAGFAYFESFPQTAKDFAQLSRTKLSMPILSVGGEKANGATLAKQMPLIGSTTRSIVIPGAGHWILEEKPKETVEALRSFL